MLPCLNHCFEKSRYPKKDRQRLHRMRIKYFYTFQDGKDNRTEKAILQIFINTQTITLMLFDFDVLTLFDLHVLADVLPCNTWTRNPAIYCNFTAPSRACSDAVRDLVKYTTV